VPAPHRRRVAVKVCVAVAPSLALVSLKLKPSDAPEDFIAVPAGIVAVQVVPLVLVRVAVFVPVPLW
jgi:hypothetical protein